MFRSITIAVAVAAVLTAGAITAFASNAHGKAVSHLARTTTLDGAARGEAISTLASSQGDAKSDEAKADAAAREAEQDADAAARAADKAADRAAKSNHGATVSAMAKTDDTALGNHGKHKKANHGGAVSEVASKTR
ncbi:MAG TPA: hypothetical protein VM674_00775 [Candidatus Acidoferrum sp.]|nr:hypothetical protein [Candidatus Acidoferrum sp.]